MRLSESKYPPGSESRCTSRANAESAVVLGAAAYAVVNAAWSSDVGTNEPHTTVTGSATSSQRIEPSLDLITHLR